MVTGGARRAGRHRCTRTTPVHARDPTAATCSPASPARGSGRSVLLCAHLDTVPLLAPVEPVLVDGGWENANEGILGADNKAAVAVILALARHVAAERPPVDLELLFTVGEEVALAGARAFDTSSPAQRVRLRLRPRLADRGGRDGLSEPLPHRGGLPGRGSSCGDQARGRPQRGARRRPRGRLAAARTP